MNNATKEVLLEIKNLRVEFGIKKKKFAAVDDVSFLSTKERPLAL